MTEQPVETEQEGFLGNRPARQSYLPNGHRIPFRAPQTGMEPFAAHRLGVFDDTEADLPADDGAPLPDASRNRMLLEAEQHAADGTRALSNGELDEGIAWLQAALAFAENYRHAVRFEVTEG